jgi:gentisate 1,2-dioxygenase
MKIVKVFQWLCRVSLVFFAFATAFAAPNTGDTVEALISQAMTLDRAGQTTQAIEQLKKILLQVEKSIPKNKVDEVRS